MNVAQKAVLAKVNLNSVIDHDDATEAEVERAIAELHEHIDAQWEKAKVRRAAAKAAKALPK